MKRFRTSLAVLAIIVLIAAALVPGSTSPYAVLAVTLLVLSLALALTRLWAVLDSTHSDTLERSLVQLRAPPAASINR